MLHNFSLSMISLHKNYLRLKYIGNIVKNDRCPKFEQSNKSWTYVDYNR